MAVTITYSRIPVDPTQRADLEKLFGSPAFLLLKEMVAASCITCQVDAMNAALYPDNEDAETEVKSCRAKAAGYNNVLDILDDMSGEEENWFTVKLEHNNQ
jgi:hypothetical protein